MTKKQVHVALGIVCCKKSNSLKILVTKRPKQTVLGGYWEFPGGKIESGESPQQTVIRELAEEVGILVHPLRALPVVEHVYDHAHVHLYPLLCRWIDGEVQNLQVSDHQWITLDNLSMVTFPPANDPILAQILQIDFSTWPA